MAKRLNDTVALTNMGMAQGEVEHSVRSRKIDNGYVVHSSSYNSSTGECTHREEFCDAPPKIVAPKVMKSPSGSNSMRDAVKSLSGK